MVRKAGGFQFVGTDPEFTGETAADDQMFADAARRWFGMF